MMDDRCDSNGRWSRFFPWSLCLIVYPRFFEQRNFFKFTRGLDGRIYYSQSWWRKSSIVRNRIDPLYPPSQSWWVVVPLFMLSLSNSVHGNLLITCGVGSSLYEAQGMPILDVLCAYLLPTFCKIWLEFKHRFDRLACLLGRLGEQEGFLHYTWCCSNISLANWWR